MKKTKLALLIACTIMIASTAAAQKQETDSFKLGMAAYCFRRFDADHLLDAVKKLDINYITVKEFHLPLESPDADIYAFRAKCGHSVIPYAVGPIFMRDNASVDQTFEFTKKMGAKMIIAFPQYELLDYIEAKANEYGIRVALHNHADQPILFSATEAWEHVRDRGPMMGMCLDIAMDYRAGFDPIADYERYHSRVFDIHIKDVDVPSKEGWTVEMGRGTIDIPAFVKALRRTGYDGVCSLEYEKDMDDPLLGIAESIGYWRGVCAW